MAGIIEWFQFAGLALVAGFLVMLGRRQQQLDDHAERIEALESAAQSAANQSAENAKNLAVLEERTGTILTLLQEVRDDVRRRNPER